jgi:hypothetical protein
VKRNYKIFKGKKKRRKYIRKYYKKIRGKKSIVRCLGGGKKKGKLFLKKNDVGNLGKKKKKKNG